MKWNDFLEKYHLYKQLHTVMSMIMQINNSINSANTHLKMKK